MLTLQKTKTIEIALKSIHSENIEELLNKEWLLTNNRGGYVSSTIVGCNTRRYHGLLIGSLRPPVNRIMALANCMEMVIVDGTIFNLSTFEFNEKFDPQGFTAIKKFYQDIGIHYDYQLGQFELTKSVYLLRNSDTVAVVYDFTYVKKKAQFVLRPFVGLRDFHSLQKSYAHLFQSFCDDGLIVRHNVPGSCELFLSCPGANYQSDEQWWFNFLYRRDKQRGQDFCEDLWTPGFFKYSIDSPSKIVFWANIGNRYNRENLESLDIEEVCKDLRQHQNSVITAPSKITGQSYLANKQGKKRDIRFKRLCIAADQFVTSCPVAAKNHKSDCDVRTTILAGFPWFADWGRDVFIALPGLLLETGRFEDAMSVLTVFASAADNGMIPNRFDDHSNTAHFNSVDASLWFINAAFQYLEFTGDSETFTSYLLPTIRWIVDSYNKGTRFGISADCNGLITAGTNETQLTWMDAKYAGHSFTPRSGKAVEINALWYNSLCSLAQFYANRETTVAQNYHSMADNVRSSFRDLFWNQQTGYLNDCIRTDGSVDSTLRPNQIFAVSLPFSPLTNQQQSVVVEVVEQNLLTPFGLRTLNITDPRYRGTYIGPQEHRDAAYHQGTVWAYLIGPFVESYLKVNGSNRTTKTKAAAFIEPLLNHFTEDGCLGQISEVFDGDSPHEPRGCIAQAWSVAELIRAFLMTR